MGQSPLEARPHEIRAYKPTATFASAAPCRPTAIPSAGSRLRDAWLSRNNANLDTSLTLEDKGVSGFTGKHRENPDRHALAAFLALVRKGRVLRGSYLMVESLRPPLPRGHHPRCPCCSN